MKNRFFKNRTYRRRKKPINPVALAITAFIVAVIGFNIYQYNRLVPKQLYYIDNLDATLPIIYQVRKNRLMNEMRAYRSDRYNMVSNETTTLLEDGRKLNLLIKNNGSRFNYIEYEVRDRTSNSLLERTKVDILDDNKNGNETNITLNIQNLIKQNTSYLLTIKIDVSGKQAYYFTNIISRPKNKLDDAMAQVEDFTVKTFNPAAAASLVKYLETSINRDTKEMYNVTLQQTFEQITFADTKMKLESNIYYSVYQAQEYSFNIAARFLTKSGRKDKSEYFMVQDGII